MAALTSHRFVAALVSTENGEGFARSEKRYRTPERDFAAAATVAAFQTLQSIIFV